LKTALYAVMFTDLLGFTERTSRQTRRENERLIRLHDGLLSPVIRAFRGWRIKSLGDAYLVIFDSATRAIACGAAIQDRLAAFNLLVEEGERLHVRVAISAGELRLQGGDVFGEAVNVAARVEGLTEPGEVRFTEAALRLADLADLEYEFLGPHEFKGIPEKVRLYRLARDPEGDAPYGNRTLGPLGLGAPDPRKVGRRRLLPFRWQGA
jgi:class 3 adenylate cyclase